MAAKWQVACLGVFLAGASNQPCAAYIAQPLLVRLGAGCLLMPLDRCCIVNRHSAQIARIAAHESVIRRLALARLGRSITFVTTIGLVFV